mmetsp:Transcript_16671/g.36172  ORF Transcript_16671/g.36172 Transcript_16671/m.36172 type:complete len:87 (+) Transcript_16671:170-430(+)
MDLRALSPLWLDQTSGMSIISWISALRTVSALHHAAALPKRGSLCTNRSLNAAPISYGGTSIATSTKIASECVMKKIGANGVKSQV